MTEPHLIYFADPMCSWCYGFSPVIDQVRQAYGRALPIRVIMGGLRPGTEQPMTDKAKAEVAGHWSHVHEATGLPFDPAVIDEPGFVYDTDPAARAVVIARRQGGDELALRYLAAAQRGFYAEGRNVTSAEVLGDLAAEFGLPSSRAGRARTPRPRPGATTPSRSAPASPASQPWWAAPTTRESMAWSPAAMRRPSRSWPCSVIG